MAEVFLCAKDAGLTDRARRDLRRAGVVVVEVDDPARCQFIRADALVAADDMLWAAIHALNVRGQYENKGAEQRGQFASNLLTVLEAARKTKATTT